MGIVSLTVLGECDWLVQTAKAHMPKNDLQRANCPPELEEDTVQSRTDFPASHAQ